jgi:glutamine amidotransferase
VLDSGIGNLHSARMALEVVGADARLTDDRALIAEADGVVLPGVGAFGACMKSLRRVGLDEVAHVAAHSGRPFLGICVGMQMLFSESEEDAAATGLGISPGVVQWIPKGPKIPQMQWNQLTLTQPGDPLFSGLSDGDEPVTIAPTGPWVYFVHSLHGVPDDPAVVTATVEYGSTINAAFRAGNVAAVQFHPEKSSAPGLALLANFVSSCRREGAPT